MSATMSKTEKKQIDELIAQATELQNDGMWAAADALLAIAEDLCEKYEARQS